ncbi:PepSY domain-containing protein [Phormidium sp. CCY1219]|uniref:PepSY domain-containing protein n=1 Tax=Phormidium sp. CCY1219 TaxID=2886104 RepID=UPI002D1F8E4D|nr:PepSY domain-containing protein [Phormidium sp. CCY1219]MEB3831566.1 PepSY domain-containing protein [Phormidium sp. CCY1219]
MDRVLFRKIHRKIAPILFFPLLLSALTGIIYRLGKSWFGMSPDTANFFMVIHQGEFLGNPIKPIYVLLVGLGLIGAIATGLTLMRRGGSDRAKNRAKKFSDRQLHRLLAPIFFLPLLLSALTGIIYRLGKSWFGMSPDTAHLFMVIHQGEYLGDVLKPIYVLLVGLGAIALLITGIQMLGWFRHRKGKKAV